MHWYFFFVAGMLCLHAPYEVAGRWTVSDLDTLVPETKPETAHTLTTRTADTGLAGASKFPDIDYALFGYNVLRGYPLAPGRDPGFTLPVFAADYSVERYTADGLHRLPKGVVGVPDVSCVTSFTSKIVKSQQDLSSSLAVAASVEGGGWGVSFSASADYQSSVSTMKSGESVFVNSEARCLYYFTKLDPADPPHLSPSFTATMTDLLGKTDDASYFHFFDKYGTHFPKEMNFGSKFIYQNKMSTSEFKRAEISKFGVAVQASYSGTFSAGGSFSLDSEQKAAAQNFAKSVETKTITVGASPPADGDALTWANSVKKSPMPMEYTLGSMESLFTDQYMGYLNIPTAQLTAVRDNIATKKQRYCAHLQSQGHRAECGNAPVNIKSIEKFEEFLHASCNQDDTTSGLSDHYGVDSTNDCVTLCEADPACNGAVFDAAWHACHLKKYCYIFTDVTGYITFRKRTWKLDMRSAYETHDSRDCTGDNRRTLENVPDVDTCVGYCHSDGACVGVLYLPLVKRCATKGTCTSMTVHDYNVNMFLKGSGVGVVLDSYDKRPHGHCNGQDLTHAQPRQTLQGCLDFCNRFTGCVAVAWKPTSKQCWLKSGCSHFIPDAAVDTYIRK